MFNKFLEKYPEYVINNKHAFEIIEQYQDTVPDEIIEIWKNYGFGTFMNSYLKIVNPNDYSELLKNSYNPIYKNPIVLFTTAMSDLIIWENNFLVLIDYRHGVSKVIESGFKYFFDDLTDEEFLIDDLSAINFNLAKEKLGEVDFNECYGYVPLLGLGGLEKAENLEKVKLKEHILLISQALGKIE